MLLVIKRDIQPGKGEHCLTQCRAPHERQSRLGKADCTFTWTECTAMLVAAESLVFRARQEL